MSTTEQLPTWDEMSELDKGAAVMHLWKREYEGSEYAIDNYPVQYIEHPALVALSTLDACRHAVTLDDRASALSREEVERSYELALAHQRAKAQQP